MATIRPYAHTSRLGSWEDQALLTGDARRSWNGRRPPCARATTRETEWIQGVIGGAPRGSGVPSTGTRKDPAPARDPDPRPAPFPPVLPVPPDRPQPTPEQQCREAGLQWVPVW